MARTRATMAAARRPPGDGVVVTWPSGVGTVPELIDPAVAAAGAPQASLAPSGSLPVVQVLFNPKLRTSDVMVPGLAGIILVFVGTIVTSIGVVRERQAGTLEQLAVMPLRPADVFLGKIAPYFMVGAADLGVVIATGVVVFHVPFRGSVAELGLGALLFLFVTLGIGVLISSVSENQGQAIQLAIMAVLPQVLLSGLVFPLSSMVIGVRWIAYVLPLTYFNQIARGVMLRGEPIAALWQPFAYLALLGIVIGGLAILRFRRYLAPPSGSPAPGPHCGGLWPRFPSGGFPVTWGLRSVSVWLGAHQALRGVTAGFEPSSVTAVVGGDGAGKTTLLRCLAGTLSPSEGEVFRPSRDRIGYMPATSGTYPDLTVAENLQFAAAAYGVPAAEAAARAADELDRLGLGSARERLAGQLSGGMRQRLGALCALVHAPDLLIMDEPTTGLDPVSRADLWWLIAQAAAGGAAVLLSTTYLDEAERASSAVVLDGGSVVATGPPAAIVAAMPGAILARSGPPDPVDAPRAWRRGAGWYVWEPDGAPGGGAQIVRPRLQEAVIVAALARELLESGSPAALEPAPAAAGAGKPL